MYPQTTTNTLKSGYPAPAINQGNHWINHPENHMTSQEKYNEHTSSQQR